jgi:hypothetical protein
MRGFRQFDAPVSVVVTVDGELADDTIAHFDCAAAATRCHSDQASEHPPSARRTDPVM